MNERKVPKVYDNLAKFMERHHIDGKLNIIPKELTLAHLYATLLTKPVVVEK